MSNNVASALDVGLWLAKEDTPGVRKHPQASDFVSTIGLPDVSQARGKAENNERKRSLAKRPAIPLTFGAGNLKFSTYIKPNGSAGNPPVADLLYWGCFGLRDDSGGQVKYTLGGLDDTWPSMTAFVKRGHTVYTCIGCHVDSATFKIVPSEGDDGLASVDWELMFLEMMVTGSAQGWNNPNATFIYPDEAEWVRRFSVGAFVQVGDDDNSGQGYEIVTVDESQERIVSATQIVAQHIPSVLIKPYLPAESEPPGVTVPSYTGTAQEKEGEGDYANILLTESTFSINHNLSVPANELDGSLYPGRIVRSSARDVSLSAQALFYEDNTKYYVDAFNDNRRSVFVPVGSVAGEKVEFEAPNVSIEMPSESGDPQFIQQQNRICYEPDDPETVNQELTLTFK